MKILEFFVPFLICIVGSASAFDLGPTVRIAQCRYQCLKAHSDDGVCRYAPISYLRQCDYCWQTCESLEKGWEDASKCQSEEYSNCTGCQTACQAYSRRVVEEILPSTLPAPIRGPFSLAPNEIGIAYRKYEGEWHEAVMYPAATQPDLLYDTWIIAVGENGLTRHYSPEEWVPTLDNLKQSALFEASLSWNDYKTQIEEQLARDRPHQRPYKNVYLESSPPVSWDQGDRYPEVNRLADIVYSFFSGDQLQHYWKQMTLFASKKVSNFDDKARRMSPGEKESFVVSWGPRDGGLMGNQVTDSTSTQISLLPGVKYLVRIASNEGPGSFAIEVDTTSPFVVFFWLEGALAKTVVDTWSIWAGVSGAALGVCFAVFLRWYKKNRRNRKKEIVDSILGQV